MLTYDDNQKAMKAHCLLAVSAQPQRLCLLLLVGLLGMQHRCYSTKVGHWRKGCSGRSRSLLLQFFLQKMFARLTLQFPSAYICICNNVRSVSFSNGELRDRDIIFRDETDLVFCFLSCWVKFPALEANSWRRRASSNPGSWVCVFFSLPPFLAFFSRSNAHTHTNKEGAKTRGKAERRQNSSLHSISWLQIHVWLGASKMIWFVHRIN